MRSCIAIDPYRSRTARACEEHLFLRPGTDAALALAMMKVIEEEGLIDAEYVQQHTVGYDSFAERLRSLSSETLSRPATSRRAKFDTLPKPMPAPSPQRFAWASAFSAVAAERPQYGRSPASQHRPEHGGRSAAGSALSAAPVWRQDMGRAMRFDLSPAGTREINMVRLAEHLLDPSLSPADSK